MKLLRLLILTGLILLVLASGCGHPSKTSGEQVTSDLAATGGATRPFLLGISALPVEAGEDSYREAFKLAAEAGEVILIQRAPPWADFLPGGTISGRTERLTRLEKELARDSGLRLFLAIDPTIPGNRGHLAGLPEDKAGADFSDPDIRSAFINYAKYLALNYKPAYLALGVEVDMYYAAPGEAAFADFVSLYFETYDEVKSVSKDTLVFPTFQYEDMLGLLNAANVQPPSWALRQRFEPKLDMLAVTSFPGLIFPTVHELPQDYYAPLKDQAAEPVSLVSIGWSSETGTADNTGEIEQVSFLYRVLSAAETLKSPLLIWYLGRDPQITPAAGFEPLAHMGLQESDGVPKSVWRVWMSVRARPGPPSRALSNN